MDFLELAKGRCSVRKFKNEKVEKEKLDLILEAGRLAPTACNIQPQRILVIDNEEGFNKLKGCTPYTFNAPLIMVICYDERESWKRSFDGKDEGEVDTSIAITHMILEAHNLGLGSTWVAHFDPQKLIQAFNIPENLIPVALLPIGYPSENFKPAHAHFERLNKEEFIYYNSFSNNYK